MQVMDPTMLAAVVIAFLVPTLTFGDDSPTYSTRRVAAEQGDVGAQEWLGRAYYEGVRD